MQDTSFDFLSPSLAALEKYVRKNQNPTTFEQAVWVAFHNAITSDPEEAESPIKYFYSQLRLYKKWVSPELYKQIKNNFTSFFLRNENKERHEIHEKEFQQLFSGVDKLFSDSDKELVGQEPEPQIVKRKKSSRSSGTISWKKTFLWIAALVSSRFMMTRAASSSEFLMGNTTYSDWYQNIEWLSDSSYIVGWQRSAYNGGGPRSYVAQLFNLTEKISSTITIDTSNSFSNCGSSSLYFTPSILRVSSSDWYFLYSNIDIGPDAGAFAQRFNLSEKIGNIFQMNNYTNGCQDYVTGVALDSETGKWVGCWTSSVQGPNLTPAIICRTFINGTAVTNEFQANQLYNSTQDMRYPPVAVSKDVFTATWMSNALSAADYGIDVMIASLNSTSGAQTISEYAINAQPMSGVQRYYPSLLKLNNQNFFSCWEELTGGKYIMCQIVNGTNLQSIGNSALIDTSISPPSIKSFFSTAVSQQTGNILIVWDNTTSLSGRLLSASSNQIVFLTDSFNITTSPLLNEGAGMGGQALPRVAALEGGLFAVAFTRTTYQNPNYNRELWGRIIDENELLGINATTSTTPPPTTEAPTTSTTPPPTSTTTTTPPPVSTTTTTPPPTTSTTPPPVSTTTTTPPPTISTPPTSTITTTPPPTSTITTSPPTTTETPPPNSTSSPTPNNKIQDTSPQTAGNTNNMPLYISLGAGAGLITACAAAAGFTLWAKRRKPKAKLIEDGKGNNNKSGDEIVLNMLQTSGSSSSTPAPRSLRASFAMARTRLTDDHEDFDGTPISEKESEDLFLQTGKRIPTAQIIPTLGRGNFGGIHLAREISDSKRFLAAKLIIGEQAITQSEQEDIIHQYLTQKNVPYVVKFLGSTEKTWDPNRKQFIRLQFTDVALGDGATLSEKLLLPESKSEKENFMAHIMKCCLLGLHGTHQAGVVHCDIKPKNLLVYQDGVYIGDPGCAKKTLNGIITEEVDGDTNYYPAERFIYCKNKFDNPKDTSLSLDARKVDAWALGISLIEMFTGEYPFDQGVKFIEKLKLWDETYFKQKLGAIKELQNPDPNSIWFVIKGLVKINPGERLTIEQALKHSVFKVDELFESKHPYRDLFLREKPRAVEEENNAGEYQQQEHPYDKTANNIPDHRTNYLAKAKADYANNTDGYMNINNAKDDGYQNRTVMQI